MQVILKEKRNFTHQPCPRCGKQAFRDRVFVRKLHDLGDLSSGRPHELHVTYSQHYCSVCRKYFNAALSDLAPPGGHYTHRGMALAVRVVVEDGLPYRSASWHLWRDHTCTACPAAAACAGIARRSAAVTRTMH